MTPQIDYDRIKPLPLKELCRVLDKMGREYSKENWDGEGARPLSKETIRAAKEFVSRLPFEWLSKDNISAGSDCIDLDWHIPQGYVLSVGIYADKTIFSWVQPNEHCSGQIERGKVPMFLMQLIWEFVRRYQDEQFMLMQ